jgi:glycoside/pentoside/hexuronide:cation symporter, GPH family
MAETHASTQKLSFVEKAGYSAADAAANFVFMTMVLYQVNFYSDVMGIAVTTAGYILLTARLWDAFFDPVMGIMADRTRTRWGRFRPWILFTAIPWGVVTYLAYSTPSLWGFNWSYNAIVVYAVITNILLMTIYSANNMPYAALGGVMTGDVQERASLNSFRFVAVNLAQLIVAGFTLPLVAKFAALYGHGETAKATGWQITMGIWAVLCVGLFLITFVTTRERIERAVEHQSSVKQDFADLLKNSPWVVMFIMTLVHFTIISLKGGAFYNYYRYFADKPALFDWLQTLHLSAPPLAKDAPAPGGLLEFLGYIVHADRADLVNSNVTDVANSVLNILEKAVMIIVILCSPMLSKWLGKKTIAVVGFALTALNSLAFYFLQPTDVSWMITLTVTGAIAYGVTIPLIWAMFADVADYSEWKTGRRATGIVFATIGFALKAGLSLGAFVLSQVLSRHGYVPNVPQSADALYGIRISASLVCAVLFAVCTVLLMLYKLNKRLTLQIADDLAERRKAFAAA